MKNKIESITYNSNNIIKVSSESDMAVIQVNIWDSQSNIKAKSLINKCFNIESHIITV